MGYMSFTGVCQICEAAEASHACDHCGRSVCDEDYDREVSACSECATQLRRGVDDAGGDRDVDDDEYMR
jgi:methionyl-tRNA synthetase